MREARDELKEVLDEKHISWRSFWNGGSTSGPISTRWNVRGWPTIYVFDEKGVIRYRNVRGPELDKALEALFDEMGEMVSITHDDEEEADAESEASKPEAKEKDSKAAEPKSGTEK